MTEEDTFDRLRRMLYEDAYDVWTNSIPRVATSQLTSNQIKEWRLKNYDVTGWTYEQIIEEIQKRHK